MNYFQILSCNSNLGNCCSDPGMVYTLDALQSILDVIQIVVPILLIIYASVRFAQMVRDPDRKNGFKAIKTTFMAATIIFFIPILANVIFGILPASFSITDCWDQAKAAPESARKMSFQYVAPYEEKEKQSMFTNPDDYQKGVPKPKSEYESTGGGNTNTGGGNNLAPGDAKGILDGAEKVHTMYEQNGWAYYNDLSQLKWGDVKYSTNNPSRMTCCATFVGSAFYVGGVFPESTINKYNYNSQYGISELCEASGWNKITSYSALQAGDVVIMSGPEGGSAPGHVQIYAGNGTWYNAGSTNAIQRDNPYSSDASGRFLWAWRKPA